MVDLLTASMEQVLVDKCTSAWVREVLRAGGDGTAAGRELWQELDQLGFLDALVPESAGGSELSLGECVGLLLAFGRYGMPLPAAHTMLARRLLADSSVEYPRGPIALAVADGSCHQEVFVPYGLACDVILVERRDGLQLVDINEITVRPRAEWGGLDAAVVIPEGAGVQVVRQPMEEDPVTGVVKELGALASAASMVGAMIRVLDMTITHVNDRQQFGRSIGKFQVVQHNLSVLAEQVAAAQIAVQRACASESSISVAIAKARASHAAPLVANTAHALTGAMGITAEYDLQLYTRALHSLRLQFGAESWWDEKIGAHALSHWSGAVPEIIDLAK